MNRLKKSFTCLLGLALLGVSVPVQATLTLTQSTLGNIFHNNETVQFPVAGTGTRVEWQVSDYFGNILKTGGVNFSNGTAVITPNIGKLGYFDLLLTEKNGATVISEKATSYAVITPINVTTMASSPFGAQTHFAQSHNPDVLPVLARAGIAHVRDEQYWASIETTKGVYTYSSTFSNYMSALASSSIRPLIGLDWSNPFYDYTDGIYTAPNTDAGREGYANYALNVLNRYPGQIDQVEVWNEYNGGTFVKGPATTNKGLYYSLMLKKTYETIKPTHPSVQVLAGATVPVAHGFLKSIFTNGAMPYLDAISVHPYVPAESADLEFSALRDLIKQYNGNVEKPIWATEFSLNVNTADKQYEAASHAVRIATQMLNQKVVRMYYYLSRDDGTFPYRGLVSSPTAASGKYTPHPVYVSYAVLIRQLYGWTSAGRTTGTQSTTYVYKFTNGSSQRYVLWATAPTTVYLNTTSANLSYMDLMGINTTLATTNGKLVLQLSQDPVYISGIVNSVTEAPNPVIADSMAGYDKTQGANGWSYGYANLASTASYTVANFTPMTWGIWQNDNYRWLGNGIYNFITYNAAHPSNYWAIRRWTSSTSGLVTITGNVDRPSAAGDGTRLRIFVDGVEKLNQAIAPQAAFSYAIQNVTLTQGSKIDAAIIQESNNTNDATTCTVQIRRVSGTPLVLSQGSLTNYSAQSGSPAVATVGTGGTSVTLTGNIWRKHPLSYNITPSTILEFTVDAPATGQLLGIGLDTDDSYTTPKRNFKIGGLANDSNFFPLNTPYVSGSGPVTITIPVGAYFTGSTSYLTFIANDDSQSAANVTFSNIRLYEGQ